MMLKTLPARPLPLENVRAEKFIESKEFFAAAGLRHLGIIRMQYTMSYTNFTYEDVHNDVKRYFVDQVVAKYPKATHIFECLIDTLHIRPYTTEAMEHSDSKDAVEYTFYITANAYENPNQ